MPAVGDRGDHALGWTTDLPDRYEIVREHGRGGMATVYLATDRKHDRPVALKVLAPELAAGIGVDRFLREIQIAAHLNHPHIVPLLDSGVVDGRPFYVMPFVEGESLKERLAREAIPVEEALRITKDVAEALAYAHDRGVVHRDIKPGNILLAGGSAVVTDFGIAAALDRAPEEQLTRTGLSVGSVGYMSPEQATGDEDVDGRSDQYSLGCVLFEMIAGGRPFSGPTARAVLGRQLSQSPPLASAERDDVPSQLDEVLRKALSRDVADRYPDLGELVRALESVDEAALGPVRVPGRQLIFAVLAAGLVIAIGSGLVPWQTNRAPSLAVAEQGDTTRYAIFPFEYEPGTDFMLAEALLHDALARWDELQVVDAFELGDALSRTGRSDVPGAQAARIALDEGAARFITGRVASIGDSLRILARLFEVGPEGPVQIANEAVRIAASLDDMDAQFDDLVVQLLFGGQAPAGLRQRVGTSSVGALTAFGFGMQAVETWDLVAADSGFWRAVEYDANYAEAYLWLALVRAWVGQDRAAWSIPADQAYRRIGSLTRRDSAMAEAIWLESKGRLGEACGRWEALAENHANDFAAWYGLAHCLRSDDAVVADTLSPSGWAFRTSYQDAIEAYETAFTKLPSILESFHSHSYRSLRGILEVSGTMYRAGRGLSDGSRFAAYPTWRGDSLAYVPYPRLQALEGRDSLTAAQASEAVRRQRTKFWEIARAWVASAPASARAKEALAYAMMLSGEPAALDTLLRARQLASDEDEQFDLARSEVWVRLALAMPGDAGGLERARFLADSLLEDAPHLLAAHPEVAAGMATLVGRADEAAAYARQIPVNHRSSLPHRYQADANALLAFSALGGPVDSIVRLERAVIEGIRHLGDPSSRAQERAHWLSLPASLAFPFYRFASEEDLVGDWVIAAQRALAEGDTATVRQHLADARLDKLSHPPFVRSLDTQLAEVGLLVGLGDYSGARDWVDPALAVLPEVDIDRLARVRGVAPLIRIAVLRATIADALGQASEAETWARAVIALWGAGSEQGRWYARSVEKFAP